MKIIINEWKERYKKDRLKHLLDLQHYLHSNGWKLNDVKQVELEGLIKEVLL